MAKPDLDHGSDDPLVFVLSPANLSGVRGRRILEGRSEAPFMVELKAGRRVPVGDVFAFISSLYYRGKRAYAERFGHRPGGDASFVVTSTMGLVPDHHPLGIDGLAAMAAGDIDLSSTAYVDPLIRTARRLDDALGGRGHVVLLGSIASGKYLEPLTDVFGERLLFPRSFIGRGDMSRGGLLLRSVAAGEELEYVVALDAPRTGPRPPRLG